MALAEGLRWRQATAAPPGLAWCHSRLPDATVMEHSQPQQVRSPPGGQIEPTLRESSNSLCQPDDLRISCKRLARLSLSDVPLNRIGVQTATELCSDALVGCIRGLGGSALRGPCDRFKGTDRRALLRSGRTNFRRRLQGLRRCKLPAERLVSSLLPLHTLALPR